MKKIILVCVALFAMVNLVDAQVAKKVMVVDYFSSNPKTAKYEEVVRNKVISGVQGTQRMRVIDANMESALQIEAERRTDESAMSDETARMGEMKTLGANYVLSGSVDALTTERKKTDDGKTYFTATLTFTVKVVDVSDGTIAVSETYSVFGGGSLLGAGATEEKAIMGTTSSVDDKMKTMIDVYFPLKGTIAEMKDSKKNKMISCYIDLGTALGVSKGQYVKVLQVKQIAGRRSEVEIGRLKVDVTVAEDLSECKVIKGGDVIYEAFNNGAEIVVETIKEGGLMGALNAI